MRHSVVYFFWFKIIFLLFYSQFIYFDLAQNYRVKSDSMFSVNV